jgi:hypothetical protein
MGSKYSTKIMHHIDRRLLLCVVVVCCRLFSDADACFCRRRVVVIIELTHNRKLIVEMSSKLHTHTSCT